MVSNEGCIWSSRRLQQNKRDRWALLVRLCTCRRLQITEASSVLLLHDEGTHPREPDDHLFCMQIFQLIKVFWFFLGVWKLEERGLAKMSSKWKGVKVMTFVFLWKGVWQAHGQRGAIFVLFSMDSCVCPGLMNYLCVIIITTHASMKRVMMSRKFLVMQISPKFSLNFIVGQGVW